MLSTCRGLGFYTSPRDLQELSFHDVRRLWPCDDAVEDLRPLQVIARGAAHLLGARFSTENSLAEVVHVMAEVGRFDLAEAKGLLMQARALAHNRSALLFELRASRELVRLFGQDDDGAAHREMLAGVIKRFREGRDYPDPSSFVCIGV